MRLVISFSLFVVMVLQGTALPQTPNVMEIESTALPESQNDTAEPDKDSNPVENRMTVIGKPIETHHKGGPNGLFQTLEYAKRWDLIPEIDGINSSQTLAVKEENSQETTLCWLETITIHELNGRILKKYKDYSVLIEANPSSFGNYDKAYDKYNQVVQIFSFQTEKKVGEITERKLKEFKCGIGPAFTKQYMIWPNSPRKRIQIKMRPYDNFNSYRQVSNEPITQMQSPLPMSKFDNEMEVKNNESPSSIMFPNFPTERKISPHHLSADDHMVCKEGDINCIKNLPPKLPDTQSPLVQAPRPFTDVDLILNKGEKLPSNPLNSGGHQVQHPRPSNSDDSTFNKGQNLPPIPANSGAHPIQDSRPSNSDDFSFNKGQNFPPVPANSGAHRIQDPRPSSSNDLPFTKGHNLSPIPTNEAHVVQDSDPFIGNGLNSNNGYEVQENNEDDNYRPAFQQHGTHIVKPPYFGKDMNHPMPNRPLRGEDSYTNKPEKVIFTLDFSAKDAKTNRILLSFSTKLNLDIRNYEIIKDRKVYTQTLKQLLQDFGLTILKRRESQTQDDFMSVDNLRSNDFEQDNKAEVPQQKEEEMYMLEPPYGMTDLFSGSSFDQGSQLSWN